MPGLQHTHKYRRAIGRQTDKNKDNGFINYYKCAFPACTHYLRAELILGKKSICNRCAKEFILPMAVRSLTNVPHCKECTRKKIPKAQIEQVIEEDMEIT